MLDTLKFLPDLELLLRLMGIHSSKKKFRKEVFISTNKLRLFTKIGHWSLCLKKWKHRASKAIVHKKFVATSQTVDAGFSMKVQKSTLQDTWDVNLAMIGST